MDVFALQEELDAAKVARSTQSRQGAPASRKDGIGGSGAATAPLTGSQGSIGSGNHDDPPLLTRDDDTGFLVAAPALHPHSAEYKLRQRYHVFYDEIIGRGGFGEVLLAQLRDVPIVGNSTFVPMSALLPPMSGGSSRHGGGVAALQRSAIVTPSSVLGVSVGSVSLHLTAAHGSSQSMMTSGGGGGGVSMSSGFVGLATTSDGTANGFSGAFQRALATDVPLFAVKKVDKSRTSHRGLSQICSEVETLSLLSHSNIVKLHEVFQDDRSMFIVMEYVRGGELGKVLKRVGHFSEAVARKLSLSILLAVEYIHEKGIVHRDLKPANCLLTKETVFSSSTAFHFAQLHAQAARTGGTGEAPNSPANAPHLTATEAKYAVLAPHHGGGGGRRSPTVEPLQRSESRGRDEDDNDGSTAREVPLRASRNLLPEDEEEELRHAKEEHTASFVPPQFQRAASPISRRSTDGGRSPTFARSASPSRLSADAPDELLTFGVDDFSGLKIADFGFAAMVGRAECLTSYCGTMQFMAPEVVGKEGAPYGKPVDMWSFGVIVYNLLSGEYPFSASNSERLAEVICAGVVSFPPVMRHGKPLWALVSPQAKDFIQKLLVVDPARRLTAAEALRHPWLRAEYSDEDLGDYPTTRGVLRMHSKFYRSRTIRQRLLGAVNCVIAAHRLVFLAKLQEMRREGISEIPLLRNFPFVVHGIFEPLNRVAAASSKKFLSNMPALKRLAEMVSVSHSVEVLDVSGNNIDDLGLVQFIVKVSFSHPSLVHLNMERNPIPPLAARALIRLARSTTHKLSIINVNHTNLGVDVIAQIDSCLKETIRKRSDAAAAAAAASPSSSSSPFSPLSLHYASSTAGLHGGTPSSLSSSAHLISSSPILRHDGELQMRIGLMQSLTASAAAAAGVGVVGRSGNSGTPTAAATHTSPTSRFHGASPLSPANGARVAPLHAVGDNTFHHSSNNHGSGNGAAAQASAGATAPHRSTASSSSSSATAQAPPAAHASGPTSTTVGGSTSSSSSSNHHHNNNSNRPSAASPSQNTVRRNPGAATLLPPLVDQLPASPSTANAPGPITTGSSSFQSQQTFTGRQVRMSGSATNVARQHHARATPLVSTEKEAK